MVTENHSQKQKRSFSVNMNMTTETAGENQHELAFGDHVHIVDPAFFIPQLNTYRKIWIYLPKSYNKTDQKYPVIYMHDGQNLFHAQPPRNNEWAVDSILDTEIREGAKDTILVGIDHDEDSRMCEYNPYDSSYGIGTGQQYVDFLVNTLKPFIDQNYRTLPDANNTCVAGASMGGLISMFAIAKYPEIFGSAGVFSPAFWIAPTIYSDIERLKSALNNHRIFFLSGEKEGVEMLQNTKKAFEILNPDGTNPNIVFVTTEDGKHNERFWSRAFKTFFNFIAK
ncbi:alpha/beta hydrolase [Pedobacter sp. AW1-32]|uniref:alpha/beta hydrolase n=1 Tax=Pedobacter sp. AW1-32 TaxID=3383026 RepID=UPI003FF104ED